MSDHGMTNLAPDARPEDLYPECADAIRVVEREAKKTTWPAMREMFATNLNRTISSLILTMGECKAAEQAASPQFRRYLAGKLGLV